MLNYLIDSVASGLAILKADLFGVRPRKIRDKKMSEKNS